jgi:hypothetical protein
MNNQGGNEELDCSGRSGPALAFDGDDATAIRSSTLSLR